MEYALDPSREVLLAYEMNGEDIPAVHGYPIRLVCPGMIAVRSCKWVSQLIISDTEADHAVQRRDYKYVTDCHDMTEVDWKKYDPIFFTGVNSGIGLPEPDSAIEISEAAESIEISGWAQGNGKTGSQVNRVEISLDNGETWNEA